MDEMERDDARRERPPRKRKKRRRRRGWSRALVALLYAAFVIGFSVILATIGWELASDVLALNKTEVSAVITLPESIFTTTTQEVEGEDGTITTTSTETGDIDYVAQLLKENGIIEYEWLFKLFARFTGAAEKISPGIYTLDTTLDYRAIVNNLGTTTANRATVDITFVEGLTVDQIFALMEENGVSTVEKLQDMAATHDYAFSFLQDIPLGDYKRLEGYLFPDTYTFYVGEDALTAINKMLVNFDSKFTDAMRELVAETEYSIRDILTIASLIEKETDGTDQATIASVIYNRLENPTAETAGFLQIDATIYYVTGETVTSSDYQTVDSEYNTYLYKGLPPGPIANPGLSSILAAMNPESTAYYYYVLNPDTGLHEFSTTYSDHLKKISEYYG